MKRLSIKKGLLKSPVLLPSSKSYANRALILASITQKPFTLLNLPVSTDVTFLISALKEVGLHIQTQGTTLTVLNSFPECESSVKEILVGEGGTTARFLAGMLCRGSQEYTLVLGERLKERPWDELLSFINQYGGEARLIDNKLTIKGPIQIPSEVKMDCSRTTQFASGIQLAFPTKKIIPLNLSTSQSYWEMTTHLIKEFKHKDNYSIPLDWSSASYPMAYAALNQKIHFPGLFSDAYQADSKFYNILKALGALQDTQDGLVVSPIQHEKEVILDVSDCLDLVPTLVFFLSHIPGEHRLLNVSNLVHKESDRLNEVIKLVHEFGREAKIVGEDLVIRGHKDLINQSKDLNLPDDHRMVMAGTLFLLHHSGGSIFPAEAVNKSYPGFFDLIS